MAEQQHRERLDEETRVIRRHHVAAIEAHLEQAWPGEGSRADVERLQAARRFGFLRWAYLSGALTDDNTRGGRDE